MVMKCSPFLRTRKHNYWKKDLSLFTTLCQPSQTQKTDIVAANISMSKLAKSGQLEGARKLFNEMPQRTVVSWNTMISGYFKMVKYSEALSLVSMMHHSDMKLNETTFSTALSLCAHSMSFSEGKQLHCLVLKSGLEIFGLVGSALLYFYSHTFEIGGAKQVFDELHNGNELLWNLMLVGYVQCNLMTDAFDLFTRFHPKRDVVTWTALISGYARSEDGCERALELFWWMRVRGEAVPNEFTFDCVIRACGRLGILSEGKVVHGLLTKYGLESDDSVGGALIEFYCNCEAIDDANRVCDGLDRPSLNALNSLIKGFILMGRIDDAEETFSRTSEKDLLSYNMMIKGYAMNGRVEDSKRLFKRMTCKTIVSSNTMISVYSRNGEIEKALKLFEETKGERNPVTWNSMMSGYIQGHQHEEALKLYVTMCRLSIERSRSTFSALLHACTCLGSLQLGQLLHGHVIKTPFVSNVYVGTSLIDMYSKCGSITDAQRAFMSITSPNVAACTSLINGFAQHGLGTNAFSLFEFMLRHRITPNAATFLGILSACGRAGLVKEGMEIFHSMEKRYGVIPSLEHYACIVDLLGRAGNLREAEEFIINMPIEADGVIWGALLNACWFWMDMELGEKVAEKMLNVNSKPISAYIILSNIYAVLGKWAEKINVRKKLKRLEVRKDRGCSWIELSSRIHVFSVEDRTHPCSNLIYATLEHLKTI